MGGVRRERPARGRIHLEAAIERRSVLLDDFPDFGTSAALTSVSLQDLDRLCVAPVATETPDTVLRQRVVAGWDRSLRVDHQGEVARFWSPVVLSCRGAWSIQKKTVSAVDVAQILDGARRLELLLRSGQDLLVPVLVVGGLTEEDELTARQSLRDGRVESQVEIRERVDTPLPRLVLSSEAVVMEVASDPYVVPTARGYTPAIDVVTVGMKKHHILLGASSLAKPLEELRLRRGSLVGLVVEVFKTGDDRTSPFSVRAVSQ